MVLEKALPKLVHGGRVRSIVPSRVMALTRFRDLPDHSADAGFIVPDAEELHGGDRLGGLPSLVEEGVVSDEVTWKVVTRGHVEETPVVLEPEIEAPLQRDAVASFQRKGDLGRFAENDEDALDLGALIEPGGKREAEAILLDDFPAVPDRGGSDGLRVLPSSPQNRRVGREEEVGELPEGTVDEWHVDRVDLGLLEVAVGVPAVGLVERGRIAEIAAELEDESGHERRSRSMHAGDQLHGGEV